MQWYLIYDLPPEEESRRHKATKKKTNETHHDRSQMWRTYISVLMDYLSLGEVTKNKSSSIVEYYDLVRGNTE